MDVVANASVAADSPKCIFTGGEKMKIFLEAMKDQELLRLSECIYISYISLSLNWQNKNDHKFIH